MGTAPPGPTPRLSDDAAGFVNERHLATLTVLRADGTPHVAPVGFTWDGDAGLARVITWQGAVKARLLRDGGRVALCQVDGARWLTLEGRGELTAEPQRVAEAVRRYAGRYRPPKDRDDRVAIEIRVDRVMGSVLR